MEHSSIMCGLLCRMIGARFVASTRTEMICQMGAHAKVTCISVKFKFKERATIMTMNARRLEKKTTGTNFEHKYVWSNQWYTVDDIACTAALAAWALEKVLQCTYIQIPYPGLASFRAATAESLGKGAFAYAGMQEPTYNNSRKSCYSHQCNINFTASNIVVRTRHLQNTIKLPENIRQSWYGEKCGYTDLSKSSGHNSLEDTFVQLARMVEAMTLAE